LINLKTIQKIILYTISLAMAALLLRYTYRDISWQELKIQLQQVQVRWIIVGIGVGLVGNLIKAYRWILLLQPIGFRIGLLPSFQALLAGYLSNLLIPRIGELVRCTLLNRTTNIPLGVLLGTSALERLLAGVGFLLILLLTLLVSFPAIAATFQTIPFPSINAASLGWGVSGLMIVVAIVGYIIYTRHASKLLDELKPFIDNLKKGFTSIRLSPIKKRIAFLTLLEWGIYYVGDYISIFALQGVEPFSWTVGLAILTMSTISFALPVQGGLGAYHLLVSSVLMAYGVPASSALLYAGVMHSTHFIGIVILGLVSTLVINLFKNKAIQS
jgi:glycosyltransferase 2 family protein